MWRKYYHLIFVLSLLLVPLMSFAQDNSAILEAITNFEHEVKRLIAAEKKQRAAEIKSLRNQIARLGGKADAGPAAITKEQYIDILARVKELASEVSVLKSANGATYMPVSSSSQGLEDYEQLAQELEMLTEQMQASMKATEQLEQDKLKAQQPQWLQKLTVNGQMRFRQEVNKKKFTQGTDVNEVGLLRSRLGLKFQPTQNVTAFLQFQDSRMFGVEGGNTLSNGSNIDLHQGYIQLANLFNVQGLRLQVGRQEIAFGGQRLIGTVGWHNVGRSFDGGRFAFSQNGISAEVWVAKLAELFEAGDSKDNVIYGVDVSLKRNAGFMPRGYWIAERNSNTNANGVGLLSRNTIGLHSKGKANRFDYEFETAFQYGRQEERDITAFLVGLSAGYIFPVKEKLRLAVAYDFLSGNDGNADKVKVFNTLYATNHKFYGFMDYFLNIPVHTRGFGLRDFMIKSSINLSSKIVGKADFHIFNYARKDEAGESSLGKEIDLTFVYKFLNPVKIITGASAFFPSEVFKRLQGSKLGIKFYSMMILNF